MNILGKVFALLTLIFSVLFLGVAATNLAVKENYKKKFEMETLQRVASADQVQKLQEELAQAKALYQHESIVWRAEIGRHEDAKKVALHHSEILMQQVPNINDSIKDTRTQLSNIGTQLGDFESTIKNLQTDARNYQKAYLDTLREKDTLRVENARTKRTLAQSHSDYNELQTQYYAQLRENEVLRQEKAMFMRLYPDTNINLAGGGVDISARVVAVDEPSGLVLLSVGSKDKVAVGMRFSVFNQDQFKAEVQVKMVYPANSACEVIRDTRVRPIAAGDRAAPSLR